MSNYQEVYLQQIEACEKRVYNLSDWEVDFIKNLRLQLEKNRNLSKKQVEVLDNVWEKATAQGDLNLFKLKI